MAEKDVHTLATFAFAQLQRDPAFRRQYPGLRNVYVCVESDLAEDVRRQASEHFPGGGEIACYFPADQRIMFVRHGGRGRLEVDEESNVVLASDKSGSMTIGMIVDTITNGPDWMDADIRQVSTREVERQPIFG